MEKVILTVNIPTTYDMLSNEEKLLWQENKYIREYASKLYTYLSKIDQDATLNMFYNLEDLWLEKMSFLKAMAGDMDGAYMVSANRIRYLSKGAMAHEFMHMASSYYDYDNDIDYTGLSVSHGKNKKYFGIGLNEGYTETLTARILYKNHMEKAYFLESRISKMLESFFSNYHDMERLYFTNDLEGVIDYFKAFASTKEINDLLKEIDTISRNPYCIMYRLYLYNKIKKTLNDWYIYSMGKTLPSLKSEKQKTLAKRK